MTTVPMFLTLSGPGLQSSRGVRTMAKSTKKKKIEIPKGKPRFTEDEKPSEKGHPPNFNRTEVTWINSTYMHFHEFLGDRTRSCPIREKLTDEREDWIRDRCDELNDKFGPSLTTRIFDSEDNPGTTFTLKMDQWFFVSHLYPH